MTSESGEALRADHKRKTHEFQPWGVWYLAMTCIHCGEGVDSPKHTKRVR